MGCGSLGILHAGLADEGSPHRDGLCVAAATVQVDAAVSEVHQFEQIVRSPERRGEDIAETGLAATVDGIALGHPVGRTHLRSRPARDLRLLGDGRIGVEQPLDVRGGVAGRPGPVVMVREGDDLRLVLETSPLIGDAGEPGDLAGDVGHAESGVGQSLLHGAGDDEPLLEVAIGVPGVGFAGWYWMKLSTSLPTWK